MQGCRAASSLGLHRTYEDAGIFWMQRCICAARHQMQALVNAKPLHPHMCDAKMQLALVIALIHPFYYTGVK